MNLQDFVNLGEGAQTPSAEGDILFPYTKTEIDTTVAGLNTAISGKQANLGFTPVQQGTGTNQLTNVVKIGWATGSKLRVQIDATDFGNIWPISINGDAATLGGSTLATINASIATKAPLASPALTGTPTAPTATAGTNTTQLATTAFATAADTALQTSLNASIATKAPLASPALTGVPTAPTATAGTNTTQVATTAFVAAGLALKANTVHAHVIADITGLQAALDAKLPIAGGNFTGRVTVNGLTSFETNGDIRAVRAGGTTGVVYLSSADRYLYYDGTDYIFGGTGSVRGPGRVYAGAAYLEVNGDIGAGSAWGGIALSTYIENRISAFINAYAVQQSRMAGYTQIQPVTSGGGNWENNAYVITLVNRVGGDAYLFGARQPQLYVTNRGWFAAFTW